MLVPDSESEPESESDPESEPESESESESEPPDAANRARGVEPLALPYDGALVGDSRRARALHLL